jgi:transposase
MDQVRLPSAPRSQLEPHGVRRVVHLSAIGVDRAQPSRFSATKHLGVQQLVARPATPSRWAESTIRSRRPSDGLLPPSTKITMKPSTNSCNDRGRYRTDTGALQPALVALEACGASHYWARELQSLGHEVVMIPPQYVKPYVQRGKSDAADAEAICEAASQPKLRKNFVPIKSPEQQGTQMLARVRNQFIGRRAQLANSIRGYAAEFGFTAPKGLSRLQQLLIDIQADATVPDLAKELVDALPTELARVDDQIAKLDKRLMQLHRSNEMSRRLATIPGVGPIGATLLSIKVVDARGFKSARNFAAWLGLTPKNHSTAGKNRLGVITRAGDGIEVRVVDPKRARNFALSAGRLAKNDAIDAEMIAWFGETFSDRAGQVYDADREELQALVKARLGLINLRIRLEA